jgi:hypothetical protein
MMSMMGKMMRDGGGMPAMPEGAAMPEMPPLCAVAWKPVASAAVDHVHRWMLGGPPPPVQPLIQVTGDGTDLVRDANGIALGGIRLPDVEVPLAAHTGVNGLGGMMVLNGASVPFTPEVVASLYRDRNDYLAKYDEALKRALEAEVLLPASATALRQQAEQVPWPA